MRAKLTKRAASKRLMSTTEAAKYLGVSPTTVQDLHRKGHFRAIKILRQFRYDVLELDAWKERSL